MQSLPGTLLDATLANGRLEPQVAGSFYPRDAAALRSTLRSLADRAIPAAIDPKLVVIPHAGISYCGPVAASAIQPWARRREPIRRIVLFGPAHRLAFDGLAVHPASVWNTPLGDVPVMAGLSAAIPAARILPEAFAGEHSLEVPLVLLQGLLPGPFEIVPVLVGTCPVEQVADALRRVWGGPETVVAISSDLSHFLDLANAVARDRATAGRIETLDAASLGAADACGFRPLAAALKIAADFDMRATTLHLSTSAASNGETGRVVGYGAFGLEYAASARIGAADRQTILRSAMAGLPAAAAEGGKTPDLRSHAPLSPVLGARRATFVTLQRQGNLRGCVGSLQAHRPLIGDAFVNAVKAGFGDPRFGPLGLDELADLTVSVSILSHRRPFAVANEDELIYGLEPDRDGLILADGQRSALFLPSVWSSLPDPRVFVRQLKQKAGLPADHWSPTLRAFRFRTESFAAAFEMVDPAQLMPLRVVMPSAG